MKEAATKPTKTSAVPSKFDGYSEQDTADKLIPPYLTITHGFPKSDNLNYHAQHSVETEPGKTGRYDGLYLSGGYPFVVLEAKRHSHELNDGDFEQARSYATSCDVAVDQSP
jgi:type I site-specific restriction endonuclease